jgi:hypothetical protein
MSLSYIDILEENSRTSVSVVRTCAWALQAKKVAGVIENYSKFEIRTMVRLSQAERMSQSEIHRRLVSVYGQKVFSRR